MGISFFESLSPIVKFVSPVGNSSVPYPFAVDKNRNYYLLGSTVIMSNVPENLKMECDVCDSDCSKETVSEEPYRYYYNNKDKENTIKIKITKRIPTESY